MRLGFALLLAFLASVCSAQGVYPAKPVRLIVTFTPGGAADFTARLVADKWSEMWREQVIVENRIGAGGSIGAEAVYRAPADGYTLLLVASAHAFNAALYPKLPFDIVKDFVPLGLATSTPMALAVNPRMTVSNLQEFTALLQARPHEIQYATCGVATAHHFAMELYKFQTKTDAVHVPYRGCAPAVVDAVGGQIDVVMSSLTTVLPHAKAGKLRTLAITSANRSASAPDIPTFRESGVAALKDYAVEVYYGLMARTGTPPDIVARLEGDLRKVIALTDFAQRISAAGIDMFPKSAPEMAAIMNADVARFRDVIREAGIRPE
ncbi:MAG TPA: tripartite tricarboxylate transporter substrate binding protein [Burkholderiales bacterium]|nr:tripartite tricarboxylate transporter substrate binding protein [Burkholderiales bacterium]